MLGHAFRVLETFYDADLELGLQQVTTRTGITKSSAFRILFTLEFLGYVEKSTTTGKYRLGRRILEIAAKVRGSRSVVQLAQPFLHGLHEQFGETVNLGSIQNREIVYADSVEGSYAFRLTATVGAVAPMHASGLGKAMLALLPEAELEALIADAKFPRLTARTITTREEFLAALKKIRRQGFATDNEEVEPQAFCVACAITDAAGRASYAISVSGPTHRMRARYKEIVDAVTKAGAAISEQIRAGKA